MVQNYASKPLREFIGFARMSKDSKNLGLFCTRPECGRAVHEPLNWRGHKLPTNTGHCFPCPVCIDPRQVKLTKKNKPYITCDPCGIQLFIRGPAGVAEFNRLAEQGERDGLPARIREIERRYRLTCSECGAKFWVERRLIKTSKFDGSFKGFRCPNEDCEAIFPWEGGE